MNAKRMLLIATLLFVLVVLLATHMGAFAQGGTPDPPNLVVPGNGSTITSTLIQICASASDNMTQTIRFEIFRAPVPDFQTDWITANPQGVNTCAAINVQNGNYTWHARGQNGAGQGGASPDWGFTVQINNVQPPTVTPIPPSGNGNGNAGGGSIPPPVSGRPDIKAARKSDGGIDVVILCQSGGYTTATNIDGTGNGWRCVLGNTLGTINWQEACQAIYGSDFNAVNNDNSAGGWKCQEGQNNPLTTIPVNPTSVPPPSGGGNPPSGCNGVLAPHLQIGQNAVVTQAGDNLNLRAGDGTNQPQRGMLHTGDIVTVIGGPRCTNGYNWWQVETSTQGTWWAVEADSNNYWLDLTNGQVQQPPPANNGNNPPVNPPSNTNCSPAPSRLHPGDQAAVSDFDANPLRVYNTQDVRLGMMFTVPVREIVNIISGPVCAWNVTWVEVGYKGRQGWAIEANDKGTYNLIPNGMALPGPGGNGEQPPTFTPVPQAPILQPTATSGIAPGGLDLYQYCIHLGYAGLQLVSNDINGWRCVTKNGGLVLINLYNACAWQYHGRLHTPMYSDYNDATSWRCYANGQLPGGQNAITHLRQIVGDLLSSNEFYELVTEIVEAHDVQSCLAEVTTYALVLTDNEPVPPDLPIPETVTSDCANAVTGIPATLIQNFINQLRNKLGSTSTGKVAVVVGVVSVPGLWFTKRKKLWSKLAHWMYPPKK